MRHLAVLLATSLAACAVDANLPADDDTSQDGSAAADDPAVSYATALTVKLTSEPAALTNQTTATFAFTTSKPATLTCRLDGVVQPTCKSPMTFTGLANGNHSFELKATAGGKSASIPPFTWTVDTTAPAVSFGSEPSNPTNQRTATFSFSAGDAVSTTCQLDGAAPVSCTSPVSYSGLADGYHSLFVGAIDAAGNSSTASYGWFVDATAPSITGLSYTCDPSGYLSVYWNVSDASGVGYGTCTYAGQTYDCSNLREWDGYVNGAQNPFTVTYYDPLNNRATKSLTIKSILCQ